MTKMIYKYFLLALLMAKNSLATSIEDINWLYQQTFPYSYTNDAGKTEGTTIDLITSLYTKLTGNNSTPNFTELSFGRVMYEIKLAKNTAAFPVAKISERLNEFKWAGPLGEYTPVIWAKKSKHIKKSDLTSDLRKLIIGTKARSIINKLIMNQGFDGSNIYANTEDKDNVLKLNADRIDLIGCDKTAFIHLIKSLNLNIDDYEIVYTLPTFEYSIAFSLDVSDDLVKTVQDYIDKKRAVSINNNAK